jgi:hypothetical protein
MPGKLDALSQDIIMLLTKHEPEMLGKDEVANLLSSSYRTKYQTDQGFHSAVTQKLNKLTERDLIKNDFSWYGTLKSDVSLSMRELGKRIR